MSGTLIMRSKDRWYRAEINFQGTRRGVLPILEEYWNVQEGPDTIIKTCGHGIMMVFLRIPYKDLGEERPFAYFQKDGVDPDKNLNAWHNGQQFDHSSNACLSPVDKYKSKMVLDNHSTGAPIRESYATKEEVVAKARSKNLFIWDGESWAYEKASSETKHNPFKRKGNRWGRQR